MQDQKETQKKQKFLHFSKKTPSQTQPNSQLQNQNFKTTISKNQKPNANKTKLHLAILSNYLRKANRTRVIKWTLRRISWIKRLATCLIRSEIWMGAWIRRGKRGWAFWSRKGKRGRGWLRMIATISTFPKLHYAISSPRCRDIKTYMHSPKTPIRPSSPPIMFLRYCVHIANKIHLLDSIYSAQFSTWECSKTLTYQHRSRSLTWKWICRGWKVTRTRKQSFLTWTRHLSTATKA